MKDIKLINVLKKLSKSDLKRLKEFIHSPYFGASQTERDLFDFIYKYAPGFDHKKLTQEEAACFVFPDRKVEISTITRLQSRILKLVELFISIHFKNSDSIEMELSLLEFYQKENLNANFKSTYNGLLKKLNNLSTKDVSFYEKKFLCERLNRRFHTKNFDENKIDANHNVINQALDTFYLGEKLTESCIVYNRQLITRIEHDMPLIPEILDFLPNSTYQDIPIIRIWHTALLLLKSEQKTEHHQTLTNLLEEHESILNKTDKRILYTYLENTAIQVSQGNAYYKTLFNLYKKQLENGVMYIDGYLLPAIFKNIVTVALRLGYIDWTENFLQSNQYKIVPGYEDKEDVYGYSVAQLRFKQGKLDDTLGVLNQMAFSDIYTKMDVRRMYMKVYYEQEDDLFDYEVNKFRGFLVENKKLIPPIHVQANRDFINICNGLNRTLKRDTARLGSIEDKITKIQILPEKSWLLEKLEALR